MNFDEKTLKKLNTLSLIAHRVRAGSLKGDRRSMRRGSSIEFADYRTYVAGDDLRRLDWNVYGRLDRPFVKLLEEQEDLAVHILLDGSLSMDWGQSAWHKFNYAIHLAAAIGSIALASGDQLIVNLLRDRGPFIQFGPTRGPGLLLSLLGFLETLSTAGKTHLNHSLTEYTRVPRRPGLVFLISDLFSPFGFQDGLRHLQSRGFEAVVIHTLSPDELDPPIAGDIRLLDAETGAHQDITSTPAERARYRKRIEMWRNDIQTYCRANDIRYLPIRTDQPWDRVVLLEFRMAGMIR